VFPDSIALMTSPDVGGRLGDGRSDVLRRAVANRALGRSLAAFTVFNIAEWASWIALLVWAYDRGGVRGASAISLLQLVPAALLALPCAAFAARLPKSWALSVGYAVQAATLALTSAALAFDAPYGVVAGAAVTASVAITLTRPTHFALLPELSQTTQDVTAANAASGTVAGIATFAGPALSGLLLAASGPASVLFATAVACGIAALTTARILPSRSAAVPRAKAGTPKVRQPSMFGALGHPGIRPLAVLVGADAVLLGVLDILLVVLALGLLHMNDAGPGILNSALGVGGLLGGAASVLLVGRTHLAPAMAIGAVTAGAGAASAGLATWPGLAFALIAVSGAGRSFVDVTAATLLQRSLPDDQLGAALGLQESLLMAGTALGALLAPLLVQGFGPREAFLVAGLIVPALAALSWTRLRNLDQHASVPGPTYALLAGIPMFSVLAQRVIERLARDLVSTTASAGTAVVVEGHSGDAFYVIESGQLKVSQGAGGVLRVLGPGDWFGELALLRDIPRTSTVTALTDVTLQRLGRNSFLNALTGSRLATHAADEYARRRYHDLNGEPG
jgi:MFS family permease